MKKNGRGGGGGGSGSISSTSLSISEEVGKNLSRSKEAVVDLGGGGIRKGGGEGEEGEEGVSNSSRTRLPQMGQMMTPVSEVAIIVKRRSQSKQ